MDFLVSEGGLERPYSSDLLIGHSLPRVAGRAEKLRRLGSPGDRGD